PRLDTDQVLDGGGRVCQEAGGRLEAVRPAASIPPRFALRFAEAGGHGPLRLRPGTSTIDHASERHERTHSMDRRSWMAAVAAGGALAVTAAGLVVAAQGTRDVEKGWVAIFNGRDLTGWESYDRDGKADVGKNWVVKDGVIHGSGQVAHLFSPRGD